VRGTRCGLWCYSFAIPLALLLYGAYLGSSTETGGARVLRLGHSLNQHHPVHAGMERMAAELAKLSSGRLRIEIYPDEQLGPERELIEMLQIGSLAMTKVSTGPLESFSPAVAVLSLPYLFRDRDHFWRVMDGAVGEELLDVSVPFGLKGLCYYDAGARSFYINRKTGRTVTTPADLSGLSIRVMKTRTSMRMVELLGAKPVPVPFGELYSALDSGTVDGAENNSPSLLTTRQYEVCTSYSLNEHTRVPDILIMSVDAWRRLSPEEQGWVKQAAVDSSHFQRELWHRAEQEALDEMEAAGLEIVRQLDPEPFREKVQALYEEPEFTTPEARRLIERIRAQGESP
jgi:tripartite ATP-independent transporter DctP family solute receptor